MGLGVCEGKNVGMCKDVHRKMIKVGVFVLYVTWIVHKCSYYPPTSSLLPKPQHQHA